MDIKQIAEFTDLGITSDGEFLESKFLLDTGEIIKVKTPRMIGEGKARKVISPVLRSVNDRTTLRKFGINEEAFDLFLKRLSEGWFALRRAQKSDEV